MEEKIFGAEFGNAASGGSGMENHQRVIPPLVVKRAKSAGAAGEAWLANLDNIISDLETEWNISVGEALFGGTHAFVAYADGHDGEEYVLKIDMPENLGGEFQNSVAALEMADGHGYVKLFSCDIEKKACLLERLGKPLGQLGYSVSEQLRIICSALQKSWIMPMKNTGLPGGNESVSWFRSFIGDTWRKLNRPCSQKVIKQAMQYLQAREQAMNPDEFVLLHGDAHGGNILQAMSGDTDYKLIDPDGIIYEKAYDLGVLMREWVDEYEGCPLQKGKERCEYLHQLTGVPEQAIWEWGYLQTVSTAFVLLQIGQEETGHKMLNVAEQWTSGWIEVNAQDFTNELADFLWTKYGFMIQNISAANRGFYGETWKVQTDKADYFVKIDYWTHHMLHYQSSLAVIQFMTDHGISFIPQVIRTKNGELYSSFKQGVAAVFEYVQGEPYEDFSAAQLYDRLAQIYSIKPNGIDMETETFGTEVAETFLQLQNEQALPNKVMNALHNKQDIISKYMERLNLFSSGCKGDMKNFYITHGDAGGNCILNDNQLFIVDWDSVKFAPIKRDAWIYIGSKQSLEEIHDTLKKNNINYTIRQERLGYYCYYFFFYYLDEYLKSIVNAASEKQKQMIVENVIDYLTSSWIYKRLAIADTLNLTV